MNCAICNLIIISFSVKSNNPVSQSKNIILCKSYCSILLCSDFLFDNLVSHKRLNLNQHRQDHGPAVGALVKKLPQLFLNFFFHESGVKGMLAGGGPLHDAPNALAGF